MLRCVKIHLISPSAMGEFSNFNSFDHGVYSVVLPFCYLGNETTLTSERCALDCSSRFGSLHSLCLSDVHSESKCQIYLAKLMLLVLCVFPYGKRNQIWEVKT